MTEVKQQAFSERRSEQRYVVEGMYARIGGERFEIVDISCRAVRLLTIEVEIDGACRLPIEIVSERDGDRTELASQFHVIRTDRKCTVVGFSSPDPGFEAVLKAANTFQFETFDESLFDYDFAEDEQGG